MKYRPHESSGAVHGCVGIRALRVACLAAWLGTAACAAANPAVQPATQPAAQPASSTPAAGPTAPRSATIWDGVFTSDQADRGRDLASEKCFLCHAASEWGATVFLRPWQGRPLADVYGTIRRLMPQDDPGSLAADEYAAIVAYMLSLQGAPAAGGNAALPSDASSLSGILITPRLGN